MSLRYIGDVLLSTPLALSIKRQVPQARVDFLVFAGTEGVLAKNPSVDAVFTIAPGSRGISLLMQLWRQYTYAIGTNASDRTALFTAAAGRTSLGFSYFRSKEWWKKTILTDCRHCDDRMHLVPLILTHLESLGIPSVPRVVMGFDAADETFARHHLGEGYVLLHPYTRRPCKYWTPEGWGALAGMVRAAGRTPVFTVSPSPADRAVLEGILAHSPTGTACFHESYTLNQLAAAIKGSSGYVGVDTVATHIAAALEVPTVALFGPTLTRHWGPWPNGCTTTSPFAAAMGVQRVGSVTVMQQEWPCVPCNRESCEISTAGRMECLAALSPDEVMGELLRGIREREMCRPEA